MSLNDELHHGRLWQTFLKSSHVNKCTFPDKQVTTDTLNYREEKSLGDKHHHGRLWHSEANSQTSRCMLLTQNYLNKGMTMPWTKSYCHFIQHTLTGAHEALLAGRTSMFR